MVFPQAPSTCIESHQGHDPRMKVHFRDKLRTLFDSLVNIPSPCSGIILQSFLSTIETDNFLSIDDAF